MTYTNHLYTIVYPNTALVASHYSPEQFAEHYISGSSRHYTGKLVFLELDPNFRDPWFDIDGGYKNMKPHSDGRPKATRFIKSYRVLEHLSFKAMRNLYITTPDGSCLELQQSPRSLPDERSHIRLYAEINPLGMMVLARESFYEFGKHITDPENPKSAPVVCYTQLNFDADRFLNDFHSNPLAAALVPGIHPSKMRDSIHDLRNREWKRTKGLNLENHFNSIPWKMIRHGFMFSRQNEFMFYRMPDSDEIERLNLRFWRNM